MKEGSISKMTKCVQYTDMWVWDQLEVELQSIIYSTKSELNNI